MYVSRGVGLGHNWLRYSGFQKQVVLSSQTCSLLPGILVTGRLREISLDVLVGLLKNHYPPTDFPWHFTAHTYCHCHWRLTRRLFLTHLSVRKKMHAHSKSTHSPFLLSFCDYKPQTQQKHNKQETQRNMHLLTILAYLCTSQSLCIKKFFFSLKLRLEHIILTNHCHLNLAIMEMYFSVLTETLESRACGFPALA